MKDIIVILDGTKETGICLESAEKIAKKLDSRLTGLYQERTIDFGFFGEPMSVELIDTLHEQFSKEKDKVEKKFIAFSKSTSISSKLSIIPPNVVNGLFNHTSMSDLIITSQGDRSQGSTTASADLDHLLMGSRRPVLVIPYIGASATIGSNVLVAWDGSVEAGRAVHDSLPILKKANKVTIYSIQDRDVIDTELGGADIAEHLAHHDVNIEVVSDPKSDDLKVGEQLLSRVADLGIDMMVMGAYGHSRYREMILGGVTRTILSSMTVPVLLAH